MTAFVIDASIAAAFAFGENDDPRVMSAIERLGETVALAPTVFFYELRNVLIVGERRGRSTPQKSADFLRNLAALPLKIVAPPDGSELMALARARKLTVYDAAYLDLAIREGLPLATLDRQLERAALAEGVALFGA
ncbi:type II toxin-antitoxin system VapC family toxin [Roseiarcus sp.]|uniref:type II toxin-antitoxin system VapC family toxin n=1 Tax=Roseiarcus sp. TaxID=1969460 RepID=UPI003F955522